MDQVQVKVQRYMHPVRAPLVPVAISLAGGIVAGYYLLLPIGLWAIVGAISLVVAVGSAFRWHLHQLSAGAVLAAVFAAGVVAVGIDYSSAAADDIVTYTANSDILSTVRGKIVTSPMIVEDVPATMQGYWRSPRTQFVIRASEISTADGWRSASGLLAVTVHQADERLEAGQEVELVGWLGRARRPDNPGQYDWSAAARANGTLARFSVPAVDGVTIRGGAELRWYEQAYWRMRSAVREHLVFCGDREGGQLLDALIIGDRHPALRTLGQTMMRAGVAHHLSISGMHLGIFLGFVYLICRLATLAPSRSAAVVLAVLAVYMILARWQAPLARSAVMAAALCLATILGRRHSTLNALAVAMILLLAIEPMDLFNAGFQLSFGIVAGLVVLQRPVGYMLFGRWRRRRGLMVFCGDHRVRRWLYYTGANWLMDGLTMAVVAYAVSAPLVAYHFSFFSPYAAPLSAILVPPMLAVLIPGYISMALAWPMPNLSYAFGHLAAGAADGLAAMVRAMEKLPGLAFDLRPVGAAWVVGCYVVLALFLTYRRLRWGWLWLVASVAVMIAATVYTQLPVSPPQRSELNLLAVGGGQCAVLRVPSGATFLIDAGTRSGFDAYDRILGPFLRKERLPMPRVAFVSHANTDHYNALPRYLVRNRLEKVYINQLFELEAKTDSMDTAAAAERFLQTLSSHEVQVVRLRAGDKLELDAHTCLEVLWPDDSAAGLGANESSTVLKITCDGRSIVLPGDIDSAGQGALVKRGMLSADVLVLPHHGGWQPTLSDFVAAVGAKYVLASSGREPFGPVAQEEPAAFYNRLKTASRYYSTPRNGWIQVRFGKGGIDVQTMR